MTRWRNLGTAGAVETACGMPIYGFRKRRELGADRGEVECGRNVVLSGWHNVFYSTRRLFVGKNGSRYLLTTCRHLLVLFTSAFGRWLIRRAGCQALHPLLSGCTDKIGQHSFSQLRTRPDLFP